MAEKTGKEVKVTKGKAAEVEKTAPSRAMSPFEEMDRIFEEMFPRRWMRGMRREWPSLWSDFAVPFEAKMLRVDVIDRENEIVVRAEVPGVDKKDLDVSLTDNAITIKGTTSREEKEEEGDYYRSEITSGSFSRTVALPGGVDGARAKATFRDGVVLITIGQTLARDYCRE